MTQHEVALFIVTRWRIEHTVEAIMMALLMQRVSMNKAGILEVIRRYCDSNSENATYKATKPLG